MRPTSEKYFEFTLLALILGIGLLLFLEVRTFINGILGSITLYILLRRTNFRLARRIGPVKAAWLIVIALTFFILIPLSLAVWYAIDLIAGFDLRPQLIIDRLTSVVQYIEARSGFDLISENSLAFITSRVTRIANLLMAGVNNFAINLFTALLLLFFLLDGGIRMESYVARLLPFSRENKKAIVDRINLIVKSNAIGIPLLALLQGVVATAGYSLCGVNNALLFGLVTGFASIIPIVGTMIVWIPLAIAQYFEGTLLSTVGLVSYGVIIISQCDNVLRMFLQKKMANTHPLITIVGVIVGLPLFGFMGVIFGPLLVALFLLFTDMFARQYLVADEDLPLSLGAGAEQPDRQPEDARFEEESVRGGKDDSTERS